MIAVGKTDPVTVCRPVVDAVVRRATGLADLTATTLRKLGIYSDEGCDQTLRVPANLLLELGAVFQLAQWEQDGFTAHLDAGIPSYKEAFADLLEKLERGLWSEEVIRSDSLSFKVFMLSIDGFSWDAPSMLGIDVQLKADDEDNFVEKLAEFLWRNRRLHQTSQHEARKSDGK